MAEGSALILRQVVDRLETAEREVREELAKDLQYWASRVEDTTVVEESYKEAWTRLSRAVRVEAVTLRTLIEGPKPDD